MFGFPFLHAVLPHSPLHVKCLADTEERVENGYVRDIVVRVRETRLTNLFSNILIGISMLFLGYVLEYIPTAVLDGLFLYLALTALYGNQASEELQSQKFLLSNPISYQSAKHLKEVSVFSRHFDCRCLRGSSCFSRSSLPIPRTTTSGRCRRGRCTPSQRAKWCNF